MTWRIRQNLMSVAVLCVALAGCASSASLRKETDAQLAACLHRGMTVSAAEKCTQAAGLESWTWPHMPPDSRVYQKSAMSASPLARAIVRVTLMFDADNALREWRSVERAEGI